MTLPLHQRARNVAPYCQVGTPGCEFVVQPGPTDAVAFKTWYSALESDLIGGRAEEWFGDQERRLGDPSGLDLGDVLDRLDVEPS